MAWRDFGREHHYRLMLPDILGRVHQCPLLGVKRTLIGHATMTAYGSKAEVPALRPACLFGEKRTCRRQKRWIEPITNRERSAKFFCEIFWK
jgi:hypothetical protein